MGRGTSDMKAGNVVAHAAVRGARRTRRTGADLVLVLYAGEEGAGRRQRARRRAATRSPWLRDLGLAIVLEPTDGEVQLGLPRRAARHADRFTGQQAHSARPWHGEQRPDRRPAGSWPRFHDLDPRRRRRRRHRLPRRVVADPGRRRQRPQRHPRDARGSTSTCASPRRARSRTPSAELRDQVARVADGRPVPADVEVEVVDVAPPAPPHADDPVVTAASSSSRRRRRSPASRRGPTSRGFAALGVPALQLRPGAHRPGPPARRVRRGRRHGRRPPSADGLPDAGDAFLLGRRGGLPWTGGEEGSLEWDGVDGSWRCWSCSAWPRRGGGGPGRPVRADHAAPAAARRGRARAGPRARCAATTGCAASGTSSRSWPDWETRFGCDHRAVFPTVYRLLTARDRGWCSRTTRGASTTRRASGTRPWPSTSCSSR